MGYPVYFFYHLDTILRSSADKIQRPNRPAYLFIQDLLVIYRVHLLLSCFYSDIMRGYFTCAFARVYSLV